MGSVRDVSFSRVIRPTQGHTSTITTKTYEDETNKTDPDHQLHQETCKDGILYIVFIANSYSRV